jgi:hypothetical protein
MKSRDIAFGNYLLIQTDFDTNDIPLPNYVSESMYPETLSYRTEWHSGVVAGSYSVGSQFSSRPNIGCLQDLAVFLQFFLASDRVILDYASISSIMYFRLITGH